MNKKNDQSKQRPVLQFAHVERKPFKGQIDVRVLDDLEAYAKYVQTQSGHEPSIDEIAEKAIAKVLNSDTGFRQWQRSQKPQLVATESPAESKTDERKARVKEAS